MVDEGREITLDELRLLFCTELAARGLDLPSLRHVVLYDMPTDVAGYVHSAGRTARRGRGGLVSCLVESAAQRGIPRSIRTSFRSLQCLLTLTLRLT